MAEWVFNKIVGFLAFICAAAIPAALLEMLAHDELGVPLQVIRTDALVSALIASGLLVAVLFSQRHGSRK
jgi:hypothetical protein